MTGLESLGRFKGHFAFAGVILVLALTTALLSAVGAWAWRDLSDRMGLYGTYRELTRHAGKADSLSAAYKALDREMDQLREALPAENRSSHVLNLLVEEAGRRDLGIAGIMAMDEIPFPGYSELPFEVELTGAFPDVLLFLHALESRGLALRMRRIRATTEGMNQARVQAHLEISVFAPLDGGFHE